MALRYASNPDELAVGRHVHLVRKSLLLQLRQLLIDRSLVEIGCRVQLDRTAVGHRQRITHRTGAPIATADQGQANRIVFTSMHCRCHTAQQRGASRHGTALLEELTSIGLSGREQGTWSHDDHLFLA